MNSNIKKLSFIFNKAINEAFDFNNEVNADTEIVDTTDLIEMAKKAIELNYSDFWKLVKNKETLKIKLIDNNVYFYLINDQINTETQGFKNYLNHYDLNNDIIEYGYPGFSTTLKNKGKDLLDSDTHLIQDIICRKLLEIEPILFPLASYKSYSNKKGISTYILTANTLNYMTAVVLIFVFDLAVISKGYSKDMSLNNEIISIPDFVNTQISKNNNGILFKSPYWTYENNEIILPKVDNIVIRSYTFHDPSYWTLELRDLYITYLHKLIGAAPYSGYDYFKNVFTTNGAGKITVNSNETVELSTTALKWINIKLSNFKLVPNEKAYTKSNNQIICIFEDRRNINKTNVICYILCDIEVETTQLISKRYKKYLKSIGYE